MNPFNKFAVTTTLFAALTGAALAQAPEAVEMTQGEVRKVDKAAKRITIKHEEIKHLDMPGMTMVFQLADPGLLGGLKTGDKVQFKAEKTGGVLVVTEIRPAR